jgi:hypothetical protein
MGLRATQLVIDAIGRTSCLLPELVGIVAGYAPMPGQEVLLHILAESIDGIAHRVDSTRRGIIVALVSIDLPSWTRDPAYTNMRIADRVHMLRGAHFVIDCFNCRQRHGHVNGIEGIWDILVNGGVTRLLATYDYLHRPERGPTYEQMIMKMIDGW